MSFTPLSFCIIVNIFPECYNNLSVFCLFLQKYYIMMRISLCFSETGGVISMGRIDERDVIFSRMNYSKGTAQYEDYYKRNPDKQEIDNMLRTLPQMGSPGTPTFDPLNSPIVDACFNFLSDIKKFSEGTVADTKTEVEPEVITQKLKGLAKYYNAKLVGVADMKEHHYYTHRGRSQETYGQEVNSIHKYGIVFAVEMDKEMIFHAPKAAESIAVTKGYIEAAVIGMVLSYYIRQLGYDARNHMDGNYLVIAPVVARDAGLGEIGRNGLLITREYGPRVRLGIVTTDMPLIADTRNDFGIVEFCTECGKCARNCPGQAIAKGKQISLAGEKRWVINTEECYKRWRCLGTDCGICLASCPFSDEIPSHMVDRIKDSKNAREEILQNFEHKHGIRPVAGIKPDWLK